jgi:hypothetical protein
MARKSEFQAYRDDSCHGDPRLVLKMIRSNRNGRTSCLKIRFVVHKCFSGVRIPVGESSLGDEMASHSINLKNDLIAKAEERGHRFRQRGVI